ncbi:autophagy-related protein 2 isoform X2 [Hevea brasiliensis]|nr:autophagy-related protein 2 isoform X2 [Hevea brasiliensis]
MFSWSLAKSAEAVFSEWAVKRLFKFLLKKKLGQFLLGDIDLNQLDIQLSQGIIQLNDLALNVDYLNHKIGSTSVIVKEGSIGSLSVKMPWKSKGFQVELDELELVLALAPCPRNQSPAGDENDGFDQDSNIDMQSEGGSHGHDMMDNSAKSSSTVVHEGVKTIAKVVKWFLTSFHVNVKKLIIAFEPDSGDEKKVGCQKTLVLRISEAECGACVSEDAKSNSDISVESFLGISQLTNFIKFQGGVVELLKMDDVDNETCSPCPAGSSSGELFSGHCPSNATPILTGSKGGFSGNLKLNIPWKNGSLDIRKVDANISIDPVELRCQPSAIKWLLVSWETYLDKEMQSNSTDNVDLNSASHFCSSTSIPAMVAPDNVIPDHGSFFSAFYSLTMQESTSEAMLAGSHLIPDWVPNSIKDVNKDGSQELDLGASMDQFFECFDGMRSSQLSPGSSGMWNWTCSVFSALTAASSLASGSSHIPLEQQHVQTNLQVNLAGISIILSFKDEDQEYLYGSKGDQSSNGLHVHYMVAECKDIYVALQICPQEMRFEGKVQHIEVADYSCNENDVMNLRLTECSTVSNSATLKIQQMQGEVQAALPPLSSPVKDPDLGELSVQNALDVFRNMTKVKLLSTSGVTHCQFAINSDLLDESLKGSTSFSVQLPHFIFWVNFWSIHMLLDLLKDIGEYVKMNGKRNRFSPVNQKCRTSLGNEKKGSCTVVATLSSTEKLKGNISIPNARIIICFPLGTGKDIGGYFSWVHFIAVDFTSPSSFGKGKVQDTSLSSDTCSWKQYSSKVTRSLHLNAGNLNIYLVNPTCKSDAEINSSGVPRQMFCAQKILSISNRVGCLSTVSMFWQDGSLTGPWIAEKAKSLAISEESRSREKTAVKGYEFASVTSVKGLEDTNSQTRKEILLSSAFFLHIHLFLVSIDLGSPQYGNLHNLLDQMINGLSGAVCDPINAREVLSVPQTSILVECASVEIVVRPDMKEDAKNSLQSELPGSWHCFKLKVQKFDMLSVSNIGGIGSANFFWMAHEEGKLWGSITGVPDKEFLLISCSNSTRKRGDGGGSNALSSRLAGSDIVYLWDPKNLHESTSVTVRCGTVVAVGGRLDWFDAISSFFTMPAREIEKAGDDNLPEGDMNAPCVIAFILKLVDIGLSYEPYLKNSVVADLPPESSYSYFKDETGKPHVACLLAASSLTLLNTTTEASMNNDYKIIVQDLGFLLCAAFENPDGTYSVEHLHEMGYVKVAQEAFVEAILRTNCKNGLSWELECSDSHVFVETCHDTTSGLILLATQLQQLFAPDLEESIVHLQTRWNNVHQSQERNEFNDDCRTPDNNSALLTCQVHASSGDANNKLGIVGLMDEIYEDAFNLDGNQDCQYYSNESQVHVSFDESLLGEAFCPSIRAPEFVSDDVSFDGSTPLIGLESSQTSYLQNGSLPELIEGYCLSELRPLSELSFGRQLPSEIIKSRSRNFGDGDLGRGNSGWYKDTSLSIIENHISEESEEASLNKVLEDKLSSSDRIRADNFGKPMGCVLLKNINVSWRMFAGSDWHTHEKNGGSSRSLHGRDTTTCLELVLSGTQFQYDLFPVGGICASKLSLSVQDFYLYDRSKSAPWKRVLGYYRSKDHPRESSSKALKLGLEAVRPDPLTPLEEYRLRIALLPILLQLHQSQLDFLIGFFGAKGLSTDQFSDPNQNSGGAKPHATKNLAGHRIADEALLPYFQKFDVDPIVLRVDYSPHHVDLAALGGGKYVELVNLVPWKGVELQLKCVHAVGVYGWGNVCETTIGEWLEDISQNQIHKVLQGLPTIRSLVAVGAGAAKLVSLPVESYRKDQRVLKGMQRGTIAFLRSISLEAIGLGVHLAAGAHEILLQAEYILTRIPPVSWPVKAKTKPNVRYNQPKSAQQGIQQ